MNEVANFVTACRATQTNNLSANISEYCTSHNGLCYTRFKQIHDNFEMLHKDTEKIKKSEHCTFEAVCERGICSYYTVGKNVFSIKTTKEHDINIYNDVYRDICINVRYQVVSPSDEVVTDPIFVRMRQTWTYTYDDRIDYILHKVGVAPSKETIHLAVYTYNLEVQIRQNTKYFKEKEDMHLAKALVLKALDLCGLPSFDLYKLKFEH